MRRGLCREPPQRRRVHRRESSQRLELRRGAEQVGERPCPGREGARRGQGLVDESGAEELLRRRGGRVADDGGAVVVIV